ncbi:MAG: HEAT repeat domain-containing protein [Haloferacaceae archaeon]
MFEGQSEADTAFLYELARNSKTSELVAYLRRGSSPAVRRRAAEALGDLSDDPNQDTTEELVRALVETACEDDDDGVRARAIDALYRHGEEALERLVREMSASDAEERPDRATSKLLREWIEADHPEFRMVAATALGQHRDKQSLSALVRATTDPDPRVRMRAVQSCGLLGHERCVKPLRDRLDDPRHIVREEAVRALGAIGSEAALEALIPVARDDEESIRRAAVEELGQFGSIDPVLVLVRALADDTDSVQRAALLSLVQLFVDAPEARSQYVRDTVAEQLSSADTRAVVPHAIDMLTESQRAVVRHNAAWLLGYVADPEADDDQREAVYDCLIDALGATDDRTAKIAAASLAQLGSDELERRLQILVKDEDVPTDVTERAETVLEEIGGTLAGEVVTNAVDYTYVVDPADYTRQHQASDQTVDSDDAGSES